VKKSWMQICQASRFTYW